MHLSRLRRSILVGLCLVAGLVLLIVTRPWAASEPTYRGKPVSVWFLEYAFASNSLAAPQTLSTRILSDGRMAVVQRNAAGNAVTLIGPTNPAARAAWLRQQMSPPPDPGLEALRALGANAVPHLAAQLRGGGFDQSYIRVFTNLPLVIQKKLPNPNHRRWLRLRALGALGLLGESARGATPELLALLKHRDSSVRRAVLGTLRTVHVERRAISQVLLELGVEGRHGDVVEIAEQTGWQGDAMARLLSTILKSPDPALRQQAMSLLERSGPAAAPELEAVTLALSDADPEVRYLAARTVEAIGANSPEITHALLPLLEDANIMVRTVARRTLLKIVPEAIPPVEAVSP